MIKAIECYKANTHSQHNRITAAFFQIFQMENTRWSAIIADQRTGALRSPAERHHLCASPLERGTARDAIEAPRCGQTKTDPDCPSSLDRGTALRSRHPPTARAMFKQKTEAHVRIYERREVYGVPLAGKKQKQKQKTEADEDLRSLDLRGALLGGGLDFLLLLKRFKPMIETQQKREQHEKQQQQHKHASDA